MTAHPRTLSVLPLLLVGGVVACSSAVGSDAGDAAGGERAAQRRMLNEGYSMLHDDAVSLERSALILYVKVESPQLDLVVREVAGFGGELRRRLEKIERDNPAIRLDLRPLPEIEMRKRRAIGMDRARYFAPVIGRSGREYERTVLIGYTNGINHERHLCEVMAEAEHDPELKRFLLETGRSYDRLYGLAMTLLEREHFRDPNGKSDGA